MKSFKFIIPVLYLSMFFPATAQNNTSEKKDITTQQKIKNNLLSEFRTGYVILLNGDTLRGMIDYRNEISMSKRCRFIAGNTSTETFYKPDELKAFRFDNGKFYISKGITTGNNQMKKLFLEYLIKGKVNIYYFKDLNGNHYLIDKEGSALVELPEDVNIKKGENGYSYVNDSKKYMGILLFYMSDAPEMRTEITETKELTHSSLIKLAKDYNKAICGDNSCLIYEKKISNVQYKLELIAGFQNIGKYVTSVFVPNNYFTAVLLLK
jgi:hypothetical protein